MMICVVIKEQGVGSDVSADLYVYDRGHQRTVS
jgi:hypothetical protein